MNRFVLSPLSAAIGLLLCCSLPDGTARAQVAPELEGASRLRPDIPTPILSPSLRQPKVTLPDAASTLAVPRSSLSPAVAPREPQIAPPANAPNAAVVPASPLSSTVTGKNRYVDRNHYEGGQRSEDLPPLLPPAVEFTERSTGCQTTLVEGKLVGATCKPPSNFNLPAPPPLPKLQAPVAAGDLPTISIEGLLGLGGPAPQDIAQSPLPGLPPNNLPEPKPAPPPRLNPANYVASAFNSAANAIARRRPRLKLPGNGDRAILYPLAKTGRISSLFGWRTHPIFGNRRFHSGTDIAAPQGTPVLAAYSGRVATASYLRGYGLTVILRHADDTQESRYAHLSEIFVRPGDWVAQGTEIGSVGSTGNSTGPHLHFEWRQRQGSQWVAVDAGDHLHGNLASTVVSLRPYNNRSNGATASRKRAIANRADWYVLPAVPPIGRLTARPFALSLWTNAWERTDTSAAFGTWSLPPVFVTLLRWQPPQFFPPTETKLSAVPGRLSLLTASDPLGQSSH